MYVIFLVFGSVVLADTPATHRQFQTIDCYGIGTYNVPDRVVLEGIVLNKPGDMLNPEPNYQEFPVDMGGQWQIFIQGEGNDHAGTSLYIGQNYELLPWIGPGGSYSDPDWIHEMRRLNTAKFGPGDRVRVTGYYLFYKGKTNINEQHHNETEYNFTVELLERGTGLPRPEVVTINELKDSADNFIFDANRFQGCEYYQGRLVRINDVNFASDVNDWAQDAILTITDGIKTFPVKLGLGSGIYPGSNNLTSPFDVIGILDQDAPGWPPDCRAGYRIWIMDYDGNGSILAANEHRRAGKPGDLNLDGIVDFYDLAELANDWLK